MAFDNQRLTSPRRNYIMNNKKKNNTKDMGFSRDRKLCDMPFASLLNCGHYVTKIYFLHISMWATEYFQNEKWFTNKVENQLNTYNTYNVYCLLILRTSHY